MHLRLFRGLGSSLSIAGLRMQALKWLVDSVKLQVGLGFFFRRAELPADPCWISLQVDLESGVTFFLQAVEDGTLSPGQSDPARPFRQGIARAPSLASPSASASVSKRQQFMSLRFTSLSSDEFTLGLCDARRLEVA